MKQNTNEWDQWRVKGLGASDICSILGISPYTTKLELWELKADPTKKKEEGNTYIQDKGHRFENKARILYELINGVEVPPMLMEYSEWPIARCSMDGFNEKKNRGVEIKLVGKAVFDFVKENHEIPKEKEYFYPQIQHQYMVSGAEKIDLVLFNEDYKKITVLHVPPDKKYIEQMLITEKEFWESIEKKEKPELSDKDGKKIKTKEFKDLVRNFVKVKLQTAELAIKEKAFKGDILAFLENNPEEDHELLIGTNFKLTNKKGKDSINWIEVFNHLYSIHKDMITDEVVNQFKENINYENLVVHLLVEFEEEIDLDRYKIEGKKSRKFYASAEKQKQKKPKKDAKEKGTPANGKKKS